MVRADSVARRTSRRVRLTALAVAVADLLAVVCLIVFFAIFGEPFGTINDVANAAVGILSAVLAWQLFLIAPNSKHGPLGLACAALGAVTMTTGSVLVIFDVTGWFLAGLVSVVGAALIGLWLLAANGLGTVPAVQVSVVRLGMVTGGVLLLGLLAIPAVLGGVDDWESAAWYVNVAQVNWLGTYVLYPIWCLRVAGHHSGRD
jgi:hypothetical protein